MATLEPKRPRGKQPLVYDYEKYDACLKVVEGSTVALTVGAVSRAIDGSWTGTKSLLSYLASKGLIDKVESSNGWLFFKNPDSPGVPPPEPASVTPSTVSKPQEVEEEAG